MDGLLRNMASIYILNGDKFLLLYRVGSRVVPPSWCGIGGHFEQEELNDAKAAILREMDEEIGFTERDIEKLSMRYITLRLKNGEVRQNYYFFAHLRNDSKLPACCDEGELSWISTDKLPFEDMPHTAKYVLEHYLKYGKNTDLLYAGVSRKDGVDFHKLCEF
mgnify:CR=1 FL=1